MENLSEKTEKQLRTDKLFDATDLEGNKNSLVFEVCKKINERLLSFSKDYIGVVPFGSQTIGYNLPGSDIDIDILLVHKTEDIDNVVLGLVEEYRQKGVEVNFVPRRIDTENYGIYAIADLFAFARGPGIAFFQNWIREESKKMSADRREKFILQMTDIWMERDKISFTKIKDRINDFDEIEYENKRRKLWENRIRNVLVRE